MNPDWHTSDINILEKKLNTSADRGLSRMAARKRLSREKKRDVERQGSLFVGSKRPAIQCFFGTRALSQLLLVLAALIFFFLGEFRQGAVIITVLIFGMAALGIMYLAAQRNTEASMLYSNPSQKVLREGKVGLTDCRNIVVGDVIEFSANDYISGDARIIYSEGLEVEEICFENGQTVLQRVNKNYIPDGREYSDPCDANTALKAGSFVLSGYGRAIVVGTGSNTYASRQMKNGALSAKNSDIKEVKYLGKLFSKIKPIICFLPIVLSLVGIFTLNAHVSSVLMMSLCAAGIVELISVPETGRIINASVLSKFAHPKNGADAVVIKNNSAVDVLGELTDVIFVGRAGITDGKKRIVSMLFPDIADREHSRDEMQEICKYLYLYQKAIREQSDEQNEFLKDGFCDGIDLYLKKSEFDSEKAKLMLHSLYLVRDGEEYFACAEYGQDIFRVSLSENFRMLERCDAARVCGREECIDRRYLDAVTAKCNDAKADGHRFYFVISEYEDKKILEGIVFFAELISENLHGQMKELSNAGINITFMFTDEDGLDGRCASAIASFYNDKISVARASEYNAQNKDILDAGDNCRIYMGFESGDCERLLLKLKSENRKIAIFGIDDRYERLWISADLYFGCDPINYSSKKYGESLLELRGRDGIESSDRISQKSRTKAEVIVHRTSSSGGGMRGVINAVNASGCIVRSNRYALRTVVMSVISPLCFTVLSFLSGIMLMSYAGILLSGTLSVILPVAVFALICADMTGAQTGKKSVESFIYESRYMIIPPVVASVAFVVGAVVFKICGFSEKMAGITPASLLSVITVQIFEIIFAIRDCMSECGISKEKEQIRRYGLREERPYVTALILCVILLVICLIFAFTPMGSQIFDFGNDTLKMLLLCPIYILSYFSTKFIINKKLLR